MLTFVATVLDKMGYEGRVSIGFRKERKLGLNIESDNSNIIIGRKGKNLDAIQLIANVYAGQLDPDMKVIVDSENYRMRHEEQLIRMAFKTAEQVRKKSGRSKLLEPMNPYERRLVHTALNDFGGWRPRVRETDCINKSESRTRETKPTAGTNCGFRFFYCLTNIQNRPTVASVPYGTKHYILCV